MCYHSVVQLLLEAASWPRASDVWCLYSIGIDWLHPKGRHPTVLEEAPPLSYCLLLKLAADLQSYAVSNVHHRRCTHKPARWHLHCLSAAAVAEAGRANMGLQQRQQSWAIALMVWRPRHRHQLESMRLLAVLKDIPLHGCLYRQDLQIQR